MIYCKEPASCKICNFEIVKYSLYNSVVYRTDFKLVLLAISDINLIDQTNSVLEL